jgi:alpha-1,2-mannosyltransferase
MASLLANTTFLTILACFLFALVSWLKGRNSAEILQTLRTTTTCWPVIGILLLGALLNCAVRIYAGSLNPGDFMQDVMAARQLLNHGSMYPPTSGALIARELVQHPPIFEIRGIPAWLGMGAISDFATIRLNAHPPLVGLLLAPLLYLISFHWIYLFITLFSSLVLLATIFAILRGLRVPFTRRDFLALAGLSFGWHPVLSTLRNGQSSIAVSALLAFAWFFLREKRSFLAGSLVGLAAAIKLYPGLLIVYFLFRQRRAFFSSFTSLLATQLVSVYFCGLANYRQFLATMLFLSRPFQSRTNMSLVAFLTGFLHLQWMWLLILIVGVSLLACWIFKRGASGGAGNMDLEYALCMVMQLLLTPIAWSHYLVVLILPLAILANWLLRLESRRSSLAAYLGLLLCFSIPDTTVKYLQIAVQPFAGYYAGWLFTSVFTVSLLFLGIWLAFLTKQVERVPPLAS